MTHEGWTCPKCGNQSFETGEIRTEGGMLSAMFDVSNKRFTSVTCEQCQYTEFYRTSASNLGKVLDFFAT